jgi:hypothetical protein
MTDKTVQDPKLTTVQPSGNAFKRKDWETITVTIVFGLSLVATIWMVIVSAQEAVFRIIPAAGLLVLVELWLIFTIPVYGKLAFWGALIFIATFLFFAVPFAALGILPPEFNLLTIAFIVVSLVCVLLLFRQRDLFLNKPEKKKAAKP